MPPRPPRTSSDSCSSGSISALVAKRERRSSAVTRSPRPGSVSSRKSSGPRRQTTRGAITRPFAVSRSASHASSRSSVSTSFETIRSRYEAASGPETRTNSRGRLATRNAVVTTRSSVRTVFRSKAERKVIEAGYDPARLPPGQYLTEKWPVLHAGTVPHTDLATWDFRVFGEVENPITLSWEELTALPAREITIDIHCVTRWSRFDTSFKGVHWSELAKLVSPKPGARYVVAHAEQDFTANVPLSALEDDEALLAYEADGEPLTPEHGWPLRLVIPKRYFWKSAKWLRGIELLDHDEPGFWERLGYHNEADFWKEERYGFYGEQREPPFEGLRSGPRASIPGSTHL